MFLKALTLKGFKSFAEPTTLAQRLYNVGQPYLKEIVDGVREQSRDFYTAKVVSDNEDPTQSPVVHYVTRLDVVLKTDPFEPESGETLRLIRTWLDKELTKARDVFTIRRG